MTGQPREALVNDDIAEPAEQEALNEEELQQQEDVEKVKLAPSPQLPSEKEIEEHNITHWPFRNWCKWCVLSRALGEQRGRARQGEVEHTVPIIGMDYFLLTSEGIHGRDEMMKVLDVKDDEAIDRLIEEKKVVKCMIVCDYSSKAVFATVIS